MCAKIYPGGRKDDCSKVTGKHSDKNSVQGFNIERFHIGCFIGTHQTYNAGPVHARDNILSRTTKM